MAGAGSVNMQQFETYFQRADSDRDGRISGTEAVGFFQGSNLPKQVLAQIWQFADQNKIGYLSRPEFYNALKLVTVAQSKRELTPDIVKAALYGPASAKIPPPQINLGNTPAPQPNMVGAAPSPQAGAPTQVSSPNYGFRGHTPSSTTVNPQFGPSPSTALLPSSAGVNQQFRPAQPSGIAINQQFGQVTSSTSMNQQFGKVDSSSMGLNQQFGLVQRPSTGLHQQFGQAASSTNMNPQFVSPAPMTQFINIEPSSTIQPIAPNPQHMLSPSPTIAAKDPKGFVATTNRPSLDPMFGGEVFSASQSSSQQVFSALQHSASSMPASSAVVPATSTPKPSAKNDPFEALQSTVMKPSARVQAPQMAPLPKSSQQVPNQVTYPVPSSGIPSGLDTSTSEQSHTSWPKMTRGSIQKYAKVFMEEDKDRDGKITGPEARNLFLSWRLPREVLKQVWDLSDQDSDSMLSLREFCIALYLMEQYREGRQLPSLLPNSVILDETLLSLAGPPSSYGNAGWSPTTGIRPQQGLPGGQLIIPTGQRPPFQQKSFPADGSMQNNQQNSIGPLMDNFHANQPSNGQESYLDSKGQEATEVNEKVENNENVLLDSREKLEFYRTKMQDLVLYKSRCDNRLNEITERARADKAEAESLEKKYQERYKQVAEIHSKLTIEDASFREIQARKTELHQAIIKMEQGGSADGILQVRADRIQSDLEELLKALADRCKKHDVQIKSSTVIELPPGWQPGIPEVAAIWDEDWDKFDDEGFSFDVAVPANSKSTSGDRENSSPTLSVSPDTVLNTDSTSEKRFSTSASAFDAESVYSADESKSPHGSPGRQTTYESPTREYTENHFRKSSDGDAETHRNFDEPSWGSFDNNDDNDSVWGFSAKDTEHGKNEYFFESNDFTASPERTASPSADSSFNKPYAFEDSVSGSPLSRTGDSPSRNNMESRDLFFDNLSGYDSFSMQDRQANLSRFDSINSTRSFDHSRDYSFDDSDPFGSTGPFKVSSEAPKKSSDNWSSF